MIEWTWYCFLSSRWLSLGMNGSNMDRKYAHSGRVTLCGMMTSSNGNIFSRYWPFVRDIHRSPVNSPHKGQWRGAFMFSLIYARINGWVNEREAGDFRRHLVHYGVTLTGTYICVWRRQVTTWESHYIRKRGSVAFTMLQFHSGRSV